MWWLVAIQLFAPLGLPAGILEVEKFPAENESICAVMLTTANSMVRGLQKDHQGVIVILACLPEAIEEKR